jgi:hypothetical protein
MAGCLLIGCSHENEVRERENPVSLVTLKFQDSTGWVERKVRGDSLSPNLRKYIRALHSARDIDSSKPADTSDPRDANPFLDDCMCESPSDSIEVTWKDGRREKYQMYCSEVLRVHPDTSRRLRVDEIVGSKLVSRWESLRARYCPNRYGCSDITRAYWRYGIEKRIGVDWVESQFVLTRLADELIVMLDSVPNPDPEVEILLTVQVKDGKAQIIAIDSVGGKYADLARRLAASGAADGYFEPESGPQRFRLIAFNYFLEK